MFDSLNILSLFKYKICIHSNQFSVIKIHRKALFSNNFSFTINNIKAILKIKQHLEDSCLKVEQEQDGIRRLRWKWFNEVQEASLKRQPTVFFLSDLFSPKFVLISWPIIRKFRQQSSLTVLSSYPTGINKCNTFLSRFLRCENLHLIPVRICINTGSTYNSTNM